ncbi:MAG: type III pantothenate kinase [Bacteroidota bacterium]
MLLAIDVGNTDIVFALLDKMEWRHSWRIPSKETPSPEAWQYKLINELLELGLQPAIIDRAIISSVVPSVTLPLQEMLLQMNAIEPLILGPELYPQLPVEVLKPDEIGTDLVANAVAAHHRFQQKCVIVDFGTALSFTTVSEEAVINGVAIAPGLKTAINALFQNTAQLPEVPLEVPKSALGQNTVHAIQAGVVLGYVGLVKHLLEHIRQEMGADVKVIATGGLSSVLKPLAPEFDEIDRRLTIEGLALIAQVCS